MNMKPIVIKSIEIMEKHYEKIFNVNEIIEKENPMLTTIVNTLSDEVEQIRDLVLDMLEVPTDEPAQNNYLHENYYRHILKSFMYLAATEPEKYKDAAIEIILDWKNLKKYTEPVEKSTWLYYRQVLDEYIKPSIKETAE